jgi:hypothetical protein
MKFEDHLPDQQLLLDVDGELSPHDQKLVRGHLSGCWKCRARRQELENAITGFVRAHQGDAAAKLPPAEGPRALLKAQLSQLSSNAPHRISLPHMPATLTWTGAMCGLLFFGVFLVRTLKEPHSHTAIVSIPDSRLTPGATLLVNRPAVCAQENIKNKTVPIALQRRVFEEYGITGADPRAYEVDYLVTPALGGADDIHNLWPHSYAATVWNAQVKDALEDRLRQMVCDGRMDLADAQKEIATNWIAAYKRHFHTDQPLAEHCRRCAE